MIHRRKCVQKKKREDNFLFFIPVGFVLFSNKITRPNYKKKGDFSNLYDERNVYRHANMRCGSLDEPSASNNNHHASCSIKISTGRGVNFLAPFIQHHGARTERRRRPAGEEDGARDESVQECIIMKEVRGKKNKKTK